MEVLSHLGRKVLSTETQLKKLNSAILATDVANSPLPWGLVTGIDFTDKHANYLGLKATHIQGKQLAQMHTQHKYAYVKVIRKELQDIAQYIKVNKLTFYKELGLYGYEVIHSSNGIIKIPGNNVLLDELCVIVLDKHAADGANSLLNVFDMVRLQANLDAKRQAELDEEQARLDWRLVAIEKRKELKALTKMMKLIGKEMLKNPNIPPRDLETWGFIVTEYNQSNNTDTAA
jgi:hypothetical protein